MSSNEFHDLAGSRNITLDALQTALGALAPENVEQNLGAKDYVRPARASVRARYDRRLVHRADWLDAAAPSLRQL